MKILEFPYKFLRRTFLVSLEKSFYAPFRLRLFERTATKGDSDIPVGVKGIVEAERAQG